MTRAEKALDEDFQSSDSLREGEVSLVVSYLQWLATTKDTSKEVENLLRAIAQDIEDGEHLNEAHRLEPS